MNERALFLYDTSGTTVTVYIRGEIDHHTAVSVRNGIDAMLFEKRPAKLILDLSAVGFMDSSGLGLIMGRLSVMTSLGGRMILRNPGREVQTILKLAGMERLIPIEYAAENSANGNARTEGGSTAGGGATQWAAQGDATGGAPMEAVTSKASTVPRETDKSAPRRRGQAGGRRTVGKRVKTPTTSA